MISVENDKADIDLEKADLKKVAWMCRRGSKELDVILARFVARLYPRLSTTEISQFKALLEIEDPVLTQWLCYGSKPANGMEQIVSRILSTHHD